MKKRLTSVNAADFCDFRGADETAAFKAALKCAAGGTLVVPRGKTVRIQTVDVPSHTTVTGGGTIDVYDDGSPTSHSLRVMDVDDVEICDVRLTQSNARSRTGNFGPLLCVGAKNLSIHDCNFDRSPAVLIFLARCTDFRIEGNRGGRSSADGIHVTRGSTHGLIRHNEIYGAGDDGISVFSKLADGSLHYPPCSDIEIAENYVHDLDGPSGSGIAIYGGAKIKVRNNFVASPSQVGILVTTNYPPGLESYGSSSIKILENDVFGLPRKNFGIFVSGTSDSERLSGLEVSRNAVEPVAGSDSIRVMYSNQLTIDRNVTSNRGVSSGVSIISCTGGRITHHIANGGPNCGGVVLNNSSSITVRDCSLTGARIGVYVTGGANNSVLNNDLSGNSLFSLGPRGAEVKRVFGNLGYGARPIAGPRPKRGH